MKNISLLLVTLLTVLFVSGCYHAKISTGLEPSAQEYDKPFASSWIFGLVPPDLVQAQEECPNGVARVETRLSFVNMLVGNLTFGIYTPMHINVTCAAATADISSEKMNTISVNKTDSEEIYQKAFIDAANKAVDSREAVYVVMK